jgi:tRNA U34 5-methylaminomethyl-2-thiouridine-forming methyltransferase MnmC
MSVPPNHTLITTEDGSTTLFSERFQEACHSTSGAKQETLIHYVQGCQVENKLNTKSIIQILEVGWGTGLGFQCTQDALSPLKKNYSFLSLEIDHDLVDWFATRNTQLKWINENGLTFLRGKIKYCELTILVGDARKTLPLYLQEYPQKWDAIYQDAFSPKKNPTLWTQEWFELLKRFSDDEVLLSTYSSSASIRKAMMEAGWKLQKGEGFGKKRSSTRALLSGTTSEGILHQITTANIPALRDDNIDEFLRR